jgi:hypothetical protein
MNWRKFWFEGNMAWGLIESPEDWRRIKVAYSDINLRTARRCETLSYPYPYFGFSSECKGKETLGEFADNNGMNL